MALDVAHRTVLESLLSTFTTAIALEMQCELVDAPTDQPHNREVFRAHFADLEGSIDRWNEAVACAQAAPQALWRHLANSAREHGITEPPFMVGALIDHLATRTLESSRRWQLGAPQEPILQHYNDRLAGNDYVSVYVLDRRVAALPAGSEPEVQRRVSAADALIRSLFEDARTCAEARQVADGRDSLLELKQKLLSKRERYPGIESLHSALGCPICQQQVDGAATPAPTAAGGLS
jgi:hypothetical protein